MMSMSYLSLIVVTLVIGMGATWWVNHQLKKYRSVGSASGYTGAQMAQHMLSYHGVSGVEIRMGGPDQNHFDPRDNSITLDPDAYRGTSITSIATACHEVGHACQFAEGYAPMRIRGSLVPAVNLASNAWIFLLMLGIIMNIAGLTTLAIIMYAVVVLFQIVTLPVEFDASRRAKAYLANVGAPVAEQGGTASVLQACALTYVAAALTSILQLLWLLGQREE
ncbi:zinc metallopeptidase [Adlercreutzia sp. ZJ473]|uniref:zinc metallopeptidase n=1 Tax=Adlercreutzia sp. ZJ473 TaxID=2722822 RepID=UPI00155424FA|nr:zinc metallopeptidase [Adlercreutzia sp. ZJ473]